MEGDSAGGQRPKEIAYVELWATCDTNTKVCDLKLRCDDKAMKSEAINKVKARAQGPGSGFQNPGPSRKPSRALCKARPGSGFQGSATRALGL
jgi:hypothetical protein